MASEESEKHRPSSVSDAGGSPGVALHELIREKRREAGLSQSALASRAGVKQSALSTYERRGPEAHALSRENIEEVAEVLGIPLGDSDELPRTSSRFALHFCPEPACPSVISYPLADGRTGYRPRFVRAPLGRPLYCTDCGEVCERGCPDCGTEISAAWHGAFCPTCGAPYIDGDALTDGELDRRQRFRRELGSQPDVVEFRHLGDGPGRQ